MPKADKRAKTETVGVRLDPKIHYLAGIAAREQGRSLSGFIEWAVRRALTVKAMSENEPNPGDSAPRPAELWNENLWDVDESDRLFNLALLAPGLLTIDEQRFWKLFILHMKHTKQKFCVEAFREFWNAPEINTTHLSEQEGND